MRVLLDTNILIASIIAHGTCQDLVEECVYQHQIVSSEPLLDELQRVLTKKLGYSLREAADVEKLFRARVTLVAAHPLPTPVCRDPQDDVVLATAIAGNCRCIVTGDQDLLVLKRHAGIAIVSPTDFWRFSNPQ